jgi:hypothetical protein
MIDAARDFLTGLGCWYAALLILGVMSSLRRAPAAVQRQRWDSEA